MNIGPIIGWFWLPLIVSGVVAWWASGWVVKRSKDWGIIDDPKRHKHPKVVHETPVPRGGGIPVWAAVVAGAMLFLPKTVRIFGILVAVSILAVVGFVDDKYEEKVSPYLRLGFNVLAALAVIGVGIGIAYINGPMGSIIRLDSWRWCFEAWGSQHCIWIWSDLFALVWLVWIQNIVGWSSGVDGQLPGFVVIAAIAIAALGLSFGGDVNQGPVITLAAITAGAYLGFLPWNWYPQKIMPGYGGKSLAGFLLGVLAILSGAKVGAMMMVLGLPFVDAVLVIIKRIREGRSPVWGGREHFHHYLLSLGWGKRKIALFYWGVSLGLAVLALRLNSQFKYFTMATVILVIAGVVIWLRYWSTFSKRPAQDSGLKT